MYIKVWASVDSRAVSEVDSCTNPQTSVVVGGHKRWSDRVVLEAHIFLIVAYTPAPVPSECCPAKNSLHGPFVATLAEDGRMEAVVEHCSEGE